MNEQVDPVCGKPVVVSDRTPSAECDGETEYFCSQACREKFVCDPRKKLSDYLYDLVILGGGPAGIAAGIYAALADLDTLLVTKSLGGQAWDSTKVVNYPGFEEIEGPDLVDRFQRHLFENLKLAHHIGEAVEVDKTKNTFVVDTEGGETFRARALIIATGMRRRRLGIPGEDRFRGKGVLEFHALLAKRFSGQDVAVVGGGNSAVQAGLSLARAGARVRLVARGYRPDSYLQEEVSKQEGLDVLTERQSLRLEGSEGLEALVVRNLQAGTEERLAVDAVFVEIGLIPNSDIARELVIRNDRGEVEVDRNCRTGLPGLYAAGDVTSTYGKRILVAAGEGAKASLAVVEFLRSQEAVRE
jgi:alkyl hydroperoxide reductase subunit F